jgi:PAS domain S-box-containing protein
MAERMRQFNWSLSPLGTPSDWPASLRTLVALMLSSEQPMFIAWGPERVMLYNDPYSLLLQNRHPAALGSRFEAVWYDILVDIEPILKNALAGQSTHMNDIRLYLLRDGKMQECHFSFSYTPVRDDEGTIAGVFCACNETTDQVKAQHEQSLFFDVASDMLVIGNADLRFIKVSPACERILGWTQEEMMAQRWDTLVHPDDLERTRQEAAANFSGKEIFSFENRYRHKDGSYRWLSWRAKPFPELGIAYGAAVDITERKQSEERINNQFAELEAIYKTAPVGLCVLDTQFRWLRINEYLAQANGHSIEAHIGKSLRELLPDLAERLEPILYHVITTKQPALNVEVTGDASHGKEKSFWRASYFPLLDDNGQVIGVSVAAADMTNEAVIREELQESEQRFRDMADSINQMIWVTRPDGYHEYYNKRWYEYTGVPYGSTDGDAWNGMFHSEDQPRARERWQHSLVTGEPYEIEYRLRRADGVYRWVLGRAECVRDKQGNIVKWYGTCTDIHDHKEVEQKLLEAREDLEARVYQRTLELQQQQTFLKVLLENISDGIVACDAEGRLSLFNRASKNLHGLPQLPLPPEEWSSFYNLYRADGKTPLPQDEVPLWQAFDKGSVKEVEIIVAPQDGAPKHLMCNGQALFDDNGNKLGAVVSMHDITDSKKREEDLAQSRAFLRQIIDSVADPIFVKDREHRWIEGNRALWNLIGLPESQLIGKSDYDVFPKEQADAFWEGDELTFTQGTTVREEKIRNGEGEIRIISTKKVPFTLATGQQGLVGVIRDVTEQQEIEEELRQHRDNLQQLVEEQTRDLRAAKEAAEEANIAKSEFLANMSHEIRTPMNAVIGLANILAMSQPLTPKQKEFIRTLQLSADALLALINDLLDIAKIEARSVELEKIPFSLTRMMQEVISIMSVRAREKGLQFTLEGAPLEDNQYLGDPTRLRQIVMNLCSNAVKFTESGSIHIGLTCDPSDQPHHERICIKVTDTGIGIARDKIDTIFQKFMQADNSINRKYGGTGLGLAITKTLTEIMGGSIAVESEPGKGSTFTITLDLELVGKGNCSSETAKATTQKTDPAMPALPRILLVEDYAPNVLVAGTFLDQFGYAYDVVGNGLDAIDRIKQQAYFAVLMDVQMHGMNGLEATQYIRAWEKQQGKPRTPIIGMTAHALAGDRERCLSVGMDDYIPKPFNPDELRSLLNKIGEEGPG